MMCKDNNALCACTLLLTATASAWPADTPDVLGASAHGHPSGFFSGVTGQLFAFSGLDGPTRSLSNFVAIFENTSSYDLRFGARPALAYVAVRPASPAEATLVATNDAVVASHGDDGTVKFAWSQWNLMVGSVPANTIVSLQDGNSQITSNTRANCTETLNRTIVLCLATVSYPYPRKGFAIGYGDEIQTLAAHNAARAASDDRFVDDLVTQRLQYIERVPKLTEFPQFQMLLNKAVSVMRVNSLAPEGDIEQHWSTPDRVPHKYMWLWDSCYHSMARSVLNDTLGWEFVQSMLSVQDPDTGFVPIERAPSQPDRQVESSVQFTTLHNSKDQTQPPLLAWAIMENHKLGKKAGTPAAELRARLEYAAPRLEKYLKWDFENRGDPTRASPLLFWTKGTESGMDNSQRFDGYDVEKPLLAVDFSVFASREASLLSNIFNILGNKAKTSEWSIIAKNISSAVHDTLWNGDSKFYFDRHLGRDGSAFSEIAAVSGLLPLWLPDIPHDRVTDL